MLHLCPGQKDRDSVLLTKRAFFSKQAFKKKLHLSFLLCPKDHLATEIRTPTILLTSLTFYKVETGKSPSDTSDF